MKIGLALSGGGTRAAVFHLGVLARLAEAERLENVARISTVSGGSLVAALVFSRCEMKWPSSVQFLVEVYPALRQLLTTVDLFSLRAVSGHMSVWPSMPFNRGRVVARLLERRWGVWGQLKKLPDEPEWIINTTCIETGKNWRFSKFEMGDWRFGRHYNPTISISSAAAASAAVPYVIGAMPFRLPVNGWFDADPATGRPITRKAPPLKAVRLWDGGAYENLGIEPLYKPDRRMIDCDDIIVSDASGLLPMIGEQKSQMNLLKGDLGMPRLFSVSSDQIRGLRSRMFVEALISGRAKGALIRMGNSVRDIDIKANRGRSPSEHRKYLSDEAATEAAKYSTNLSALPVADFDLIARHGYECSDATLTAYRPDLVPSSKPWEEAVNLGGIEKLKGG